MPLNFVSANSEVVGCGDNTPFDMGSGNFTVMIWYRLTNVSVGTQFFTKGQSGAANNRWQLGMVGGTQFARIVIEDDPDFIQAVDTVTTDDGLWHHLVGVRDNSVGADGSILCYVDGVLKATTALPVGFASIDQAIEMVIGCFHNGSGTRVGFMNGDLDDARIYKGRALSADEILNIFTMKGRDGIVESLTGRYMMNEFPEGAPVSVAGSVKDSSPSGLNGTPTNTPTGTDGELNFKRRYMQA